MNNIEYANALRRVADFYEQNAEMPRADILIAWTHSAEDFAAAADLMGPEATKEVEKSSYPCITASRDFGGINLHVKAFAHNLKLREITPAIPAVHETVEDFLARVRAKQTQKEAVSIAE